MATFHTPLFMQRDDDTPVPYSAAESRRLIESVFGAVGRVCSDDALRVTQRGAGANGTVDVAEGLVVIPGDDGPYIGWQEGVHNEPVGVPPSAGHERYELIIATQHDELIAGTDSNWVVTHVSGASASAGTAVIPTLPDRSTRLAVVKWTDTMVSVTNSAIADWRIRATPPAMVFADQAGLPLHSFDGQPASTADGKFWVRSGGSWHEMRRLDYGGYATNQPADLASVGETAVNYGTAGPVAVTADVKVRVTAILQCFASGVPGHGASPGVAVRFTTNGNTTNGGGDWHQSPTIFATSANTLDFRPFTVTHIWEGVPTGAITANGRVEVATGSDNAKFAGAELTVTVDPVP